MRNKFELKASHQQKIRNHLRKLEIKLVKTSQQNVKLMKCVKHTFHIAN